MNIKKFTVLVTLYALIVGCIIWLLYDFIPSGWKETDAFPCTLLTFAGSTIIMYGFIAEIYSGWKVSIYPIIILIGAIVFSVGVAILISEIREGDGSAKEWIGLVFVPICNGMMIGVISSYVDRIWFSFRRKKQIICY